VRDAVAAIVKDSTEAQSKVIAVETPDPLIITRASQRWSDTMAGRKPFTPIDEQRRIVRAMAGYGVPHELSIGVEY
jgi:hypothetical protein